MNIEEMKNNVGNLNEITANLEAAVTELEVRDGSDTTIAYLVILRFIKVGYYLSEQGMAHLIKYKSTV